METPIKPHFNTIVDELNDITLTQIANLFEQFLREADNQLFQLAEVADNNEHQNQLFEAKAMIRQHGEQIRTKYCTLLEQRLSGNTTAQPATKTAEIHESMQLVDLKEFEDWLSAETIIRRANSRYYKGVSCLEQRYSQLVNQDICGEALPFSIDNICHAMQDTFRDLTLSPEVQPILYRLFDHAIINQLDDLYDTLNSRLKSRGILPNIESQVLRERKPIAKDNNASFNGQLPAQQKAANSPAILDAAQNVLALLRQSNPEVNVSNTGNVVPASINDIINQLNTLQTDNNAIENVGANVSLSEWLEQQSQLVLDHQSRDLMTLTDSIFQTLNEYPQISEALTNQIKRLQIPIAKATLLDHSILSNNQHPVHALLNQLIELCVNSDMPNQTLEKKFDTAISNITTNFQQDPSVFTQTLEDLSGIASQQHNASERNTMRIAQTYEGRQRVKQAQEAVDREIQRRISPPQAPEVVLKLIDNGWRELLKLTYLRSGQDSDLWHEQLATLDQLLLWISDINSDENLSQSTIQRDLEADSFADLINQQLQDIFPGDYRFQDTVEHICDTLKGERPATMVTLKEALSSERNSHELQKELEAANPQLNRWFKRAKNLKAGDEFSYLGDASGQRNIKLAWVSDNRQHFVFVNNRGQKVLDYDLVDLANEMSKGLSPVTEKSEWPLVERSLYSTVQEAYQQLAFKSSHDELTNLLSRKECEKILGNTLLDAKSKSESHCLLYIDIDKFSLTNNLHGHVAGDQLIIDTSKVIEECAPENSIVARMAGNEFVMLLQHRDTQDSHRIADEIRKTVANHNFGWQKHNINFTISIGLKAINKYTENVVDLLRNAVSACQVAKDNGGNRIHDSSEDKELHSRREKLLAWIDKLNSVLSSDKLVLRGQKICPLNDREAEPHYEILIALKDDNGELISPVEFIEAAECYNRMQKVDRWVIENTFLWLQQLALANQDAPAVSINLSGNSLNDDQFLDFILEQFAQYKIPTTKICFEVTETATINNLTEAADFIREIKRVGCKFSLDDFGSGNASYQYLKHLPVDYLKIDGMFVQDIVNNKNDYALVKSINEIAHLMGKKTIAEYAETEEIITVLKEIGVDYIQGYAISRPELLTQIATAPST
ncbi:DUF1631 family protein [Oceanicoccus sp. KOV_DT_Chl]|uniref:DUF1631 family protein n=1 Tax=Oceanicoccus sp. KOV_DT_Chl TaxID=1904639 RepID=UPI00135C8DE1|nr:DUF1631 family protein [Oceanicoccus sp. KOV_DT_Chl]